MRQHLLLCDAKHVEMSWSATHTEYCIQNRLVNNWFSRGEGGRGVHTVEVVLDWLCFTTIDFVCLEFHYVSKLGLCGECGNKRAGLSSDDT